MKRIATLTLLGIILCGLISCTPLWHDTEHHEQREIAHPHQFVVDQPDTDPFSDEQQKQQEDDNLNRGK